MKVKVIAKLNKRLWPSTKNTPLPNPLIPNDILEVVEEVKGESPASSPNNKWYKTDKGFYVWSEGVEDISKENLIIKITNNTFAPEQLSGTYWQDHFPLLHTRPEIFNAVGRFEIKGQPKVVATGFCISDQYVLTCKHVVRAFATGRGNSDRWTVNKHCKINFQADGIGSQEYTLGKSVRICWDADLALVEYRAAPDQPQLTPLIIASAEQNVQVGQPLMVIGHPAENFDATKKLSTASVVNKDQETVSYKTIVRKGNSGSPVINASLQVVAVHSNTNGSEGVLSSWGANNSVILNFLKNS